MNTLRHIIESLSRLRQVVLLLVLFTLCSMKGWADGSLLDGKKWTTAKSVSGHSGTMQGAAYYNGKIYQFTDKCAQYGVYDIATNTWSAGSALNTGVLANCHFGSACFGPESTKTYTVNGVQHTSTFPLLFVTGHDKTSSPKAIVIYVIDLQQGQAVTQLRFEHTDNRDDKIAAYDFDGGKIYIFGYPEKVMEGHTPYTVWTYSGVNFNTFASESVTMSPNLTGETNAQKGIGGPNAEGIQENLACGTLQDCHYHNGYIYYATSRGSEYNRTEFAKVHALNVSTWQVEKTMVCNNATEPEGFAFDGTNFYMTCGGNKLWKLSAGSGYDANNYQPATLISGGTYDGYYEITNASQFVWFKSMVYNGCTTMKAYLANDIDMSGQTDPFTYYIYDNTVQSGTSTYKFEAQFAFRGTFDGNGHKISNVNITSTPYYNDGVFPYVMGATIKNVTVEGNIKLTTCKTSAGTGQPVSNVGLVGYMDGGTLENVDVKGLTIDETVAGVSGTINKLIGSENGTITKTNCVTENPSSTTHSQNSGNHVYINGFCALSDAVATENGYYETPEGSGTEASPYLIDNAGKLWWFANYVNGLGTGNQAIHAKLTADINMEGSTRGSFPGIGKYQGAVYSGTFDGQGHTISNFYRASSTFYNGLFTNITGTVKKFNINGEVYCNNQQQHGSVVGLVETGALVEDVHSSVSVYAVTGMNQTGGFAGRIKGTVNRCRYSGTIQGTDGNAPYNKFGGFVGSLVGGTISNCLFDGKMITSSNNSALYAGGFAGGSFDAAGGKMINCLMVGTITSTGTTTGVGVIVGNIANNTYTANKIYYSLDKVQSGVTQFYGVKGSSATVTIEAYNNCSGMTWSAVKDALNDGSTNWGINSQLYPVPGETDGSPAVTYTITFNSNGGSDCTSIIGAENSVITLPTPTRTGYTFTGWTVAEDGSGEKLAAGSSYTITGDATLYAQWTEAYTITFNTNGGDECASKSGAKNTVITLPSPTKSGYSFTGWNTANDGSGTTHAGGSSYTITGDATLYAQWTVYTTSFDANGFNTQFSTCDEADKYEAATLDTDGYYIIDNAGKLFWFANQVNAGNASYNAKVTKDIDMDGTNHTDFPGIGYYVSTSGGDRKPFSGNFDGQGHRIYNCNITTNNSSYWGSGLIGYAYATGSPKKEIKNFTLEGKVIAKCGARAGGVLGYVADGYSISGITSSVNIESTTLKTGGLAGFISTSDVSKCRFNGTISNSNNWTGGLIAEVLKGCTISDCLFDGTINATRDNADVATGSIAAVIGGANANTVSNCLSFGTITTKKTGTNTGKVFGRVDGDLTLSNVYYGAQGTSTPTVDYNANGKTITGSVTPVGDTPNWEEIKTTLNNGTTNWGISSKDYPVPGDVDATQYTVTFNSKGGSECASVTKVANTVITLPSPTKDGYVFAGWTVAEDGTGTKYDGGASYTVTANITLYAQWAVAYTITFNTNGGSACESVTKAENSVITLPTTEKSGFVFNGWNTAEDGSGTNYNAGDSYTIIANATLYAQWKETFTITFNSKGGSACDAVSNVAGTQITLPTPIRADYIFNSWNTKEDGTGTSYAGGASYTITANATLYAQWTEDEAGDYRNGFHKTHDKSAADYYQAPVEVTNENYESFGLTSAYVGYYQVKNAGNMFWISKNFSSIENTRKYVMTADINMEGNDANHEDWAGIATTYSSNNSTHFQGVFDGLGHKFSNYYMKVTSGSYKAMFGVVTKATIKNFSIDGKVDIETGSSQYGAVVGRINEGPNTFEDIYSSVNITVAEGKTPTSIGGIIGQCSSGSNLTIINRCRYSGTITGNSAFNGLGGILGNTEGKLTMTNCLFDGSISSTSTATKTKDSDGIRIGGLAGGQTGQTLTIENCLVAGTISVNESSEAVGVDSHSGIVFGDNSTTQNLTISNTYYSTTGCTSGLKAVGLNICSSTSLAAPTEITTQTWEEIKTSLNGSSDPTNWGINSQLYPVPGEVDGVTKYTITFNTNGGTAIDPIVQVAGTDVTAPANPTKTGYTFDGWKDADGNATTVPTTMPEADLTLYAKWNIAQFTITFNMNDATSAAIAAITQDYGTTITKPANPTRDEWNFNGWVPAIPDKMPGENITCVAQWTQDNYVNGFNTNTSCEENKKYEKPLQITSARCTELSISEDYATNGYYEVKNAGNMFWIAQNLSADNNTRKYVVTDEINMDGTNHNDWKGIGDYNNNNNSKHFMGTFDGLGHKFTNYYMKVSASWKAMFCVTNANAVIKDFTISGDIAISGGGQIGAVVGRVAGTTTLEDIHSAVNITVESGKTIGAIGGIIGQAANVTTLNRCRYNGTITGNSSYNALGGIIGNAENPITMDNCLFDGTISTTAKETRTNEDDGIKIGGLCGRNNNTSTITNSMSKGTITVTPSEGTFDGTNSNVGIIFGTQTKTSNLTITNTFYSVANSTSGIKAVGTNKSSDQSKAVTTELPAEPVWETIRTTLGGANWVIDQEKYGKEYPIPAVYVCEHNYDTYGFCTKCTAPEPIGEPVLDSNDGKYYYMIDHFADLGQFAAMVNRATKGTEINAKVTKDIDLTDLGRDITTMIGDKDHPYCGTFDGQGYSCKGFNVTAGSEQRYVGVFACVGIKDTDATKVKNGIVKNFSVDGTITASYFAQWDKNSPLVMGVIGEIYSGTVENVHSSVNFKCTSGTRSHIGGVVGGSLHNSNDVGEIIIKNCSFEGTMTLNACDAIGGIVGYAQHKTTISNTMFSGSIKQNYTRPVSEEDNGNNQGPCSTYIGGVLGYCNSVSNGVQNSIIVGDMESNLTDFLTDAMSAKKNNMNICVGFDGEIATSSENYYGNYITPKMTEKYHQLPSAKFSGTAKVRTDAEFATGWVCAELNADASATDNPWGQILGYQVGANKDPKSPAQRYPYPGYTDPKKTTYRVIRTQNATDNTKYNYTADYYFFDDFGDTTPVPSDAASMKVKRVKYTRVPSNDKTGLYKYISICFPIALTQDMLPHYCTIANNIRTYSGVDATGKVTLGTVEEIQKGVPYFLWLPYNIEKWGFEKTNDSGYDFALNPVNPTGAGIYGAFNTIATGGLTDATTWKDGQPIYKLHPDGETLVRCISEEYHNSDSSKPISHCYPYHAYLKLPTNTNPVKELILSFDDDPTSMEDIVIEVDDIPADAVRYNLQGQRVNDNAKGIIIVNGKKYFVK